MSSANLTREETAARAAGIRLHTVEVDLDLRSAPDAAATTFPTRSTFAFTAVTDTTWVDFIGESVIEVIVNDRAQPVEWDGARIRLRGLVADGATPNVVRIDAAARYSTSGEGLHRFRDPVDDATYLYTQYEPADCRRDPCLPDMKARWRFTVAAPTGWEVLSNGAETSRDEVAGECACTSPRRCRCRATSPPSPRVPTIASTARIAARRPPSLSLCSAARRSPLTWTPTRSSTSPDGGCRSSRTRSTSRTPGEVRPDLRPRVQPRGHGEPGLVTFTEAYVFRGASTTAQHEARANTILHEMAHMWFGDLATMRWWDDLWLKESFADYMGTHAAAAVGLPGRVGQLRHPAQGMGIHAGPAAHHAPDRRRYP
jgi:aminopeptidase N